MICVYEMLTHDSCMRRQPRIVIAIASCQVVKSLNFKYNMDTVMFNEKLFLENSLKATSAIDEKQRNKSMWPK